MWRCPSPDCNCEGNRQRYLDGDPAGANELFKTLKPMVEAILGRILRHSQEEREDVQQIIFLKMFHKLSMWRDECKLCFWVRPIAIREAVNQLRIERGRKRLSKSSDDPDGIVDPKTQPLSPEVWKCIDRTIERLEDNMRLAYDLHVKQGMTVEQTAKTVNKQERIIYLWLAEIRKRLLTCLD